MKIERIGKEGGLERRLKCDDNELGRLIRENRKVLGIVMKRLGMQLDTSEGYICTVESGRTVPSLKKACMIADILRLDRWKVLDMVIRMKIDIVERDLVKKGNECGNARKMMIDDYGDLYQKKYGRCAEKVREWLSMTKKKK